MNQNITTARPLPRSLDPLDDESLIGFLLRLAHHNGTDPAQVASRMGLTDNQQGTTGVISPWLLVDMDKPRLVRAARAAQLQHLNGNLQSGGDQPQSARTRPAPAALPT